MTGKMILPQRRHKAIPMKITKQFSTDVEIVDGERAIKAAISTGVMDADKEVLIPQGCDATEFEKNPVVYLNHNYYELPVGKCVGMDRKGNKIIAKTVLAERPEDYPEEKEWVPDTLLSLFQQKIIRGFSVGFTTIESRMPSQKDYENYGGELRKVYSKWKLFEYSVAPLMANPDALAMAVSKGFKETAATKAIFGDANHVHSMDKVIHGIPSAPEGSKSVKPTPHRVYFIPKSSATSPTVEQIANEAVQKARGRIYVI
jgi:hypothetical protein